jgi:putative DNA primase/helicase
MGEFPKQAARVGGMNFLDFARGHGIIIDSIPPMGVWKRYKTEDHPKSKNGAVKFLGTHGFVQNHATMQEVSTWRNEGESTFAIADVQRIAREGQQDIARMNAKAAAKAQSILERCTIQKHAYTASKGFKDEVIHVWKTDVGLLAVIPMWVSSHLVGCQLIAEDGTKKFLFGQRSSGAEFIFSNGGKHYLCEGYATGLSIRHALKNLKNKYTIHVCFSAGNMVKVASKLPGGVVVADNDKSGTGERVAREIGWPFWMSDEVGEDFNDAHIRLGLFAVGQSLIKVRSM